MKRYKLLKDLPTFNKGDIFRIDEDSGCLIREKDGVVAYAPYTLGRFNILDSEWLEELPGGYKRWRAEKGGLYRYVQSDGGVVCDHEIEVDVDDERYEIGNYFKTEEEAQKASDWLKAFTILRDDTKGFKPDWEDGSQLRWGVEYNYDTNRLLVYLALGIQDGVIYFATRDDAEESIKAHERQWRTFFNCGAEE